MILSVEKEGDRESGPRNFIFLRSLSKDRSSLAVRTRVPVVRLRCVIAGFTTGGDWVSTECGWIVDGM